MTNVLLQKRNGGLNHNLRRAPQWLWCPTHTLVTEKDWYLATEPMHSSSTCSQRLCQGDTLTKSYPTEPRKTNEAQFFVPLQHTREPNWFVQLKGGTADPLACLSLFTLPLLSLERREAKHKVGTVLDLQSSPGIKRLTCHTLVPANLLITTTHFPTSV